MIDHVTQETGSGRAGRRRRLHSRRPDAPRCGRAVLALLCAAAAFLPVAAPGGTYQLGVQDKVRVRIIEWRAGQAAYQEWTALGADYAVNTAGAVSLPLIGEIPAAGRTTEEVAVAIADTLQQRVGLLKRPAVSVEIVQFRPVYILGEVERPGEYPYRPNLTVLEALGVAGGFYRLREPGLIRLKRDQIVDAGDIELARLEIRRTVARRARLEAELAGAKTIEIPPELRDDREAASLIAEESSIMAARAAALQSQLTSLAELKELYAREVTALNSKIESQERQVALARRELKGVGSLVEKGLASTMREFSVERTVAELEGKVLDFQTASLRAKQEIRKAERDALSLQNEHKTRLAAELQEVRARLDQLAVKVRTAAALLEEVAMTGLRVASEQAVRRTPVFSIIRKSGDKVQRIPAGEDTLVEPGDVVRVESAFPQG